MVSSAAVHSKNMVLFFVELLLEGGIGSAVVECLTRDRMVVGSSLTGVTELCP